MRFLRRLLAINTPLRQQLLDAALVTALLPHMFMAKLPILIYGVLVVAVLSLRKSVSGWVTLFFGILGLLTIAVTFFGAFNYVGIRELGTFIQLVSALLIYAVSLQRLSGKVNFYLVISPMLLLALSYFFYNSIFMLAYAVTALYIFLLLMLWSRMKAPFVEALRSATILFVGALPVVALLFMVFPRISFERMKDFGFKDTASLRTGHDGLMHIGSKALLVPSKKVVMEVWFDDVMPSNEKLYFRGSVLYEDHGEVWKPLLWRPLSILGTRALSPEAVSYRVTMYPHRKRWIYLLDYPHSMDRKSNFTTDRVAMWDTPIDAIFRYGATSLIARSTPADVEPFVMYKALEVQYGRDPRSEAAMYAIASKYHEASARLDALVDWFAAQRFQYTLKPDGIDLEHPIDSFAFAAKRGYCVHFASAFASMARMLDLPSRVVTGFKGDRSKSVENYLVVREEDAHAWVEVYLAGKGWLRVDPTGFASGMANDTQTVRQLVKNEQGWWNRFTQRLTLRVMYAKFVIQKWVLYYDRSRQMALLRELMQDTLLVLKFAGSFALLIAAGLAIFVTLRRERCKDPVLCAMRPLLGTLAKAGIVKSSGEDMKSFLNRASDTLQQDLDAIDRLYHESRYGKRTDIRNVQALERLCRRFKLEKQPQAAFKS